MSLDAEAYNMNVCDDFLWFNKVLRLLSEIKPESTPLSAMLLASQVILWTSWGAKHPRSADGICQTPPGSGHAERGDSNNGPMITMVT